jgi:hypothetical protein
MVFIEDGFCRSETEEEYQKHRMKATKDPDDRTFFRNMRRNLNEKSVLRSAEAYVDDLSSWCEPDHNSDMLCDFRLTFLSAHSEPIHRKSSASFVLRKTSAEFKPEVAEHVLVDEQDDVHMLTRSHCQQECLLASRMATTGTSEAVPFSCMSFSFCGASQGRSAVCLLSGEMLTNRTDEQVGQLIQENRKCNVYEMNPLAQFWFKVNKIVHVEDDSFRLLREEQTDVEACALRCLSLGPLCRTFTALREVYGNGSLRLMCDYLTLNAMHLTEYRPSTHYASYDPRATIYASNFIETFESKSID